MMDIIDLLASDNYIIANKDIARRHGLDEAIILGELASEFRYWKREGKTQDGWFFSTIQNVEDATTIKEKRQRAAINNLVAAGLLEVKLEGMPAKRYVRLSAEKLLANMTEQAPPEAPNKPSQNGGTSSAKTAEQAPPNPPTKNNNITITNNNNKKSKSTKQSFEPLIIAYTEDETTREKLRDWLDVRKAKRAAMTERAIKLNLSKLDDLARASGMSINEYLDEIIRLGWGSFFEIKNRKGEQANGTNQRQAGADNRQQYGQVF